MNDKWKSIRDEKPQEGRAVMARGPDLRPTKLYPIHAKHGICAWTFPAKYPYDAVVAPMEVTHWADDFGPQPGEEG